jgi:type I restriction enzyme S subunit
VKCIDEEIPFEIPESWEWCRLGSVVSLISGQDFPPDKYNSNEDGIPYIIGASNIFDGKLQINRWTTTPSVFAGKGDLLLVCKGAGVGKMCLCDLPKAHIARQIQSIRVYNNHISIEYIKQVLDCRIEDITSKANGLIPGLNRELILNFFIPIPPVDEQKKINQNIISSFELINSINRNKLDLSKIINQAKSKILDLAIRGKLVPQDPNDEPASVLLERIKSEHPESKKKAKNTGDNSHYPFEIPAGWEWSKLGCIASYKKGPFGSNITKSMFIPDSINAIKVYEQKNAIYKDFNLGNYYISEAKFEELKGFEVHPNDILVSCAGTIGETYVMPQDIRKGIINQALMRIKLYNYEMLDFYLMYFDFVLKNLANEEGKGTAIKNIPPFDILKNFLIPLPPLSEQKKIIKKIKEIFNSLDRIANSIKA